MHDRTVQDATIILDYYKKHSENGEGLIIVYSDIPQFRGIRVFMSAHKITTLAEELAERGLYFVEIGMTDNGHEFVLIPTANVDNWRRVPKGFVTRSNV